MSNPYFPDCPPRMLELRSWAYGRIVAHVTDRNEPQNEGTVVRAAELIAGLIWAKHDTMIPRPSMVRVMRDIANDLKRGGSYLESVWYELGNYPLSSERQWASNYITAIYADYPSALAKKQVKLASETLNWCLNQPY